MEQAGSHTKSSQVDARLGRPAIPLTLTLCPTHTLSHPSTRNLTALTVASICSQKNIVQETRLESQCQEDAARVSPVRQKAVQVLSPGMSSSDNVPSGHMGSYVPKGVVIPTKGKAEALVKRLTHQAYQAVNKSPASRTLSYWK